MDVRQHTGQCTRRHQEAEQSIKASLHSLNCPRCRLNLAAPELFKAITNDINAQTILVEALRGDLETTKTMLRKMCSIHAAAIAQTGVPLNEAFAQKNDEDEEDIIDSWTVWATTTTGKKIEVDVDFSYRLNKEINEYLEDTCKCSWVED
jgi:hypothetical protein